MKKIISLVLIFFITFVFFGCADLTYVVEYKSNGEIAQTFSVNLDKTKIEQNGYSYLEICTKIYNLCSNYLTNKNITMQTNLEKYEKYTPDEMNEILTSITHELSATESGVFLKITYPNRTTANLVNTDPTQEDDEDNVRYIDNFLTKTMVQKITPIYTGYNEMELYSELNALYNQNNEFSDEDLTLTQVIAFSNSRYKSNADRVVYKNSMTYHIWNINSKIDQNGQNIATNMEIYLTIAKPVMWYVVSVVIVVLFIIFSFVYVKYSKNKQNKLKYF